MLLILASHESLYAATVQVRQIAGEEFIQANLYGKHIGSIVPIPFGFPAVIVPPQFQLGDATLDMKQIPFLFEGVNRPCAGFVTVTNSHPEGYVFCPEEQGQ